MRVLPVLDIMNGQVVRGIGGRRNEYRPVVSTLLGSSAPLDVAMAFRRHFGLTELYLADLDAIAGAAPALAIYSALREAGFGTFIDAGLPDAESAATLAAAGVENIVFGLETLRGPGELEQACNSYGPRVWFSLDMRDGEPLGDREAWKNGDSWSVVERAIAAGVRQLIVLDLARVGIGAGLGTQLLCRRIVQSFPDVEVLAGGGVRGVEDLRCLLECGVGGVLLASALHDGSIRPEQLAEFTTQR